jgi:hypothetical protein
MAMTKRIYLTLLSLAICICLGAQSKSLSWSVATAREVALAYGNACDWYLKNENYCFSLKYTSYKDHVSNEINESSTGICKRRNNRFRTEALGNLMIQSDSYKLVIDTLNKSVVVANPDKQSPQVAGLEDVQKLLKFTRALKKMELPTATRYRVEFKNNAVYTAYEFTVNKSSGYLESLVYYYGEQKESVYENEQDINPVIIKSKPRLEIKFTAVNQAATENDFRENGILVAAAGKIKLANKYKSYKLKDYRYQ